jgi:pilus assembly protein CpaB
MTYRLRNIAIALVLALVAALLTTFYVSNYKKKVQQGESDVPVYVATKDIPAGTEASEVLAGGFVESVQVDKRNLAPGAAWKKDQLDGLVAVEPIYAGEQLTTRRFKSPSQQGVRSQISGTERVFQIPGDKHQLLVGTLRDGDHVDVVGNWNVPEQDTHHFSRVVLRDILVVRAPKAEESTSAKLTQGPQSAHSAMLALTDTQAQKLFWIAKNGDWSLQLRPATDAADSPETAETSESMLLDGFKPHQLSSVMDAAERLFPASERNSR